MKIIKNERISAKENINVHHRPITITLENEEMKSKILKNLIKIKNVDVVHTKHPNYGRLDSKRTSLKVEECG